MAYKRNKKVPKHLLGTLLGSAVSIGSKLFGDSPEKMQEEANRRQAELELANRYQGDRERSLANKPSTISSFYQAKGGKINNKGMARKANGGMMTDPTDPKKNGKKTTTARQRNKASRKKYLDRMYNMGLDTTNVVVNKGRGRLLSAGSTQRALIRNQPKPTVTGNFKNTRGGVTRLPQSGASFRAVQQGYPVETEEQAYGGMMAMNTKKKRMAKGGKIGGPSYRTRGGKLKPLSSDMEKAYGNRHGETTIDGTSGVKLYGKGGQAKAEIEGGETVKDGVMVYSDRTKVDKNDTYADKATKLARKKATLELEMNDKNAINRATAERKIKELDMEENMLFNHQEMRKGNTSNMVPVKAGGGSLTDADEFIGKPMKFKNLNVPSSKFVKTKLQSGGVVGINNMMFTNRRNDGLNDYLAYVSPGSSRMEGTGKSSETSKVDTVMKLNKRLGKMAKGGKIPKAQEGNFLDMIGEDVAPFIDNVGNLLLTADTPSIAQPRLETAPELETRVNVAPQLGAVTEAVERSAAGIQRGVPNSNVARANITDARLRGAEQKGRVLAQKENTERDLRNRNTLQKQQVQARNLDRLRQFDAQNLARQGEIQSRISENLSNLSGDFVDRLNRRRDENLQREQLDTIKQSFLPGVVRRTDLKNPYEINRLKDNPRLLKEAYDRYKGTPEESQFLEATGYDPFKNIVGRLRGSKDLVRRTRTSDRYIT
jgi:hypothetical protein